ncbi:MAG: xylulokinase [Gemmatimonadaceae bacterium]|nr:xylulokinase [Gemmatimonadaceae bacterium]
MITLGIDIGTSGVKVALVEHATAAGDVVLGSASAPLTVQRPQPGWSEQDPAEWWQATLECVDALRALHPAATAACGAIGLSGQMHGATLLDGAGAVLRPCILWNDGRSSDACAAFEAAWPQSRAVTGNLAMPGFTAPKLLWVREHEPALFARIATVLLPKAYVRLQLCGEAIEEMSDASGTLWLDVGQRRWSADALAATSLTESQMPRLVEGTEPAGRLRAALAARWGMIVPPLIAGGAGDNAAGAVAVGAVQAGDAFVSLGTSGVLWCTTDGFAPNTDGAVHAFCHAVPGTWHQMGVLLSAASCLGWWAGITGRTEEELLAELEGRERTTAAFIPYLSGERTPHDDARVRGGFAALDAAHDRADMTLAVLEGVAHAMRDARDALAAAGTHLTEADLLGGGARSPRWCQVMADVLGIPLHAVTQSEIGCAVGAARLAAMALLGGGASAVAQVATRPARTATYLPRPDAVAHHDARHAAWAALYRHAHDYQRHLP